MFARSFELLSLGRRVGLEPTTFRTTIWRSNHLSPWLSSIYNPEFNFGINYGTTFRPFFVWNQSHMQPFNWYWNPYANIAFFSQTIIAKDVFFSRFFNYCCLRQPSRVKGAFLTPDFLRRRSFSSSSSLLIPFFFPFLPIHQLYIYPCINGQKKGIKRYCSIHLPFTTHTSPHNTQPQTLPGLGCHHIGTWCRRNMKNYHS